MLHTKMICTEMKLFVLPYMNSYKEIIYDYELRIYWSYQLNDALVKFLQESDIC